MANRAARQSAYEWSQIIAEFNQSGQTVEQFCAQHGYALSTFNRWKLRHSKQHTAQSAVKSSRPAQPSFVEAMPAQSGTVTITLDDTVRLECPLSMGVEQIARLARAVNTDERV